MRPDPLTLAPPRDCCFLIGATLCVLTIGSTGRCYRPAWFFVPVQVFFCQHQLYYTKLGESYDLRAKHYQWIVIKLFHGRWKIFIPVGAIVRAKMCHWKCLIALFVSVLFVDINLIVVSREYVDYWPGDGPIELNICSVLRRTLGSWKKWLSCLYINYCFLQDTVEMRLQLYPRFVDIL